jgi:hypothetical protein
MEAAKRLVTVAEQAYYTPFMKSIFENAKGAASSVGENVKEANDRFQKFLSETEIGTSEEGSGVDLRSGGAIQTHNYFHKKKQMLKSRLQQQASKYEKDTDVKKLIEPIMKACGILRMRKNIHDVHDHSIAQHAAKKDKTSIEAAAPRCEHCGGMEKLKAHRQSNEIACKTCYEGKGLTKSRRIMNEKNTEDLATTSHPPHKKLSEAYNNYIMKDKKVEQPENAENKTRPANPQWQRIVESARPYFRNDPEHHLRNFTQHKITEPLPDNYKHTLKNTALIGGKLHTMLHIEKKHMSRHHLDNLKHNYAWHAAHLPKGAGVLKSHNLVGAGDQFEHVAQNIEDARDHVQALASTFI